VTLALVPKSADLIQLSLPVIFEKSSHSFGSGPWIASSEHPSPEVYRSCPDMAPRKSPGNIGTTGHGAATTVEAGAHCVYPGKQGEPYDRPASSPIGMPASRISFDVVQKSASPRPANMTRKMATMRSPDRTSWRETDPTPLPSLFFYHERQTHRRLMAVVSAKIPPLLAPTGAFSSAVG
jgi:hypothetical protein